MVAQRAPASDVESPRRLVLLRHGRTAWNLERRAQGHTDVPLDEVGHAEAAAAAPVLARMRPSRLWSSDLSRASQTARYVAEATGLPVVPDPRLRENDLGERSGLTPAEFEATFPQAHAAWLAGDDAPQVPGAESREEMVGRALPALEECLAALTPGETGVVVMHGWCAKASLFALLDWPPELNRTVRSMDNCGWAILATGGTGAPLRLESYNETADPGPHLADFASDGPVG
ncbi:MAG: histidine phosphatase family protein [Marmoricola sp.]